MLLKEKITTVSIYILEKEAESHAANVKAPQVRQEIKRNFCTNPNTNTLFQTNFKIGFHFRIIDRVKN